MGSYRMLHLDSKGLQPYAAGLRALERDILYPLADGEDQFYIDHGPDYHPFFSTLGQAHFLVALGEGAGEGAAEVVGNMVAVRRRALLASRPIDTFYMCDYKIAPKHRGGALTRRFWMTALGRLAVDERLWGWTLVYGAAMRGRQGDVMHSVRKRRLHPGALFAPAAHLNLYFTNPQMLAGLDPTHCPPPPQMHTGLDLSVAAYNQPAGLESTHGRKDLRRISTGQPWSMTHLSQGPACWHPTWGHYLQRSGQRLLDTGQEHTTAAFAIDDRLKDHQRWLKGQGLTPDSVCTIYILSLPHIIRQASWIHLATSEI